MTLSEQAPFAYEEPKKRSAENATPAMAQYIEIKHANPDCILFYRMGDFYELFFEDAELASRALGIALTKRGKHEGEDIPMCGVPVHAADDYLQKLIALDFRIAVCEQLEDPSEAKKRGSKAVVKRGVVRLVTPGTITEESLLDPGANCFLSAVSMIEQKDSGEKYYAIAWADISTGVISTLETNAEKLSTDLCAIQPKEIIASETIADDEALLASLEIQKISLTKRKESLFKIDNAESRILDYFEIASLEGVGSFQQIELSALAALLDYIDETQRGARPSFNMPRSLSKHENMRIDAASRMNLELVQTLSGAKSGSVLNIIDRTITGNGRRLLGARLSSPLIQVTQINQRLNSVEIFLKTLPLRQSIIHYLKSSGDIARALSRLSLERGGPRDLLTIQNSLKAAVNIKSQLASADIDFKLSEIEQQQQILENTPSDLLEQLENALDEDVPLLARDGGYIKTGFDPDLDELRILTKNSRALIAKLQAELSEKTNIKSLKIKHNGVLGYFIEVPQRHGEELMTPPHNQLFIHRQTLANVMRFSTEELSGLQSKITEAGDKALKLEIAHFETLRIQIIEKAMLLQNISHALAVLDLSTALATLAEEKRYVKPEVTDDNRFDIDGGRHPVVEAMLTKQSAKFIPNDCDLSSQTKDEDKGKIWLVTGPNMGGKSTFLRQNALIAIMAQMGSYVPAKAAIIGCIHQLFCRVGAADDLARGRSTFMVEMVETASILNKADEKSLVILDELGRGTATYDGLSIAWAAVEHLHNINQSRTLFATHFHELTKLKESLERLEPVTMGVKEWRGKIIFLHQVMQGASQRSYGIQVAKLAGLPNAVLHRAKLLLEALETKKPGASAATIFDELPLFSALPSDKEIEQQTDAHQLEADETNKLQAELDALSQEINYMKQKINDINPDELTPRQALDVLYEIKKHSSFKE